MTVTLTDVVAVLGLVAGVSGLLVSSYQSTLVRRDTTLSALLPLYEQYHCAQFRQTRRKIYEGRYDFDHLTPEEEEEIRSLLNALEFLGTLVQQRVVDFRVVRNLFRRSPEPVWDGLRAFVEAQRGATAPSPVPDYAKNYEALVQRYRAPSRRPFRQ